jgi:Secretion system C-terminal sorting domain
LRKHIKIASILLCFTCVFHTIYAQHLGGSKNDKGISFCQSNQKFYLSGTTRSFGAGSEDVFIVKVNDNFQSQLHVEWGGTHHDIVSKIIRTTDQKNLVVGHSWDSPGGRTGVVLAKFDDVGNNLWVSYFGGSHNDYSFSVMETSDGGYLLTGINRAEGSIGAIFLIKTNNNGVQQWQKFYDTNNKDIGVDVVENLDSTLMILANTSSFVGKIANASEYFSNEASKMMLIKTDKQGNEIWRNFYGGVKHDFAKKIVYGGNNNYYFIGSSLNNTNGSFDIILNKIDGAGNVLWRKNYGGTGYEYGNNLDINSNGELLLTGTSNSFSTNEDPDIIVIKTDPNGNEIWTETFGGPDSDYGNDGQFLADGSIAILGSSKKEGREDLDLYFIKISNEGELIMGLDAKFQEDALVNLPPTLFPNPASAFIKINTRVNKAIPSAEFLLYDITGKVLQQTKFNEFSKTIYFNSALVQGVYIYKIIVNKKTYSGKLIIN